MRLLQPNYVIVCAGEPQPNRLQGDARGNKGYIGAQGV